MGSLHDDMMENHARQMQHSIHCGGYRGQGRPFDESQCTCRETGSASLSREEQDDLFRQMRKWLAGNNGVMRERLFFLSEVENVYRMKATILQQRKTIEAGDTAIRQLDDAASRYSDERDAAIKEVKAVLEQLDHLAEVWGDEGVFRRCRDRLRNLVQ